MSENKNNLLLFFDRPTEPCFMQKGDDKAVFELPDNYLVSINSANLFIVKVIHLL